MQILRKYLHITASFWDEAMKNKEISKTFNINKIYQTIEGKDMSDTSTYDLLKDGKTKDALINELQEKLEQTKKELQENKVDKTVEIKKLIQDRARFIDNLSHDLATPLTPLITLLPLIKDDVNNEETKKLADTCLKNVKYIKRVIENARELSDVSASDFFLKKENVNDIIDDIIKRYEVVFKSYNIKIDNNLENDTYVKTDKARLIELFDHLISNSVNAMPEGGKIQFFSRKLKKDDETFIEISVCDTGTGLTQDQLDRMFKEFYKTDDSRHKLDSTGLGLAICKKIVEKHGGRIWADSHGKGKGTTIIFTLPSVDSIYSRSF